MAGAGTVTPPEPCLGLSRSEAGLALQWSCGVTSGCLLPLSEPRFPATNTPSRLCCHSSPQGLQGQAAGLCTRCSFFLQCFSLVWVGSFSLSFKVVLQLLPFIKASRVFQTAVIAPSSGALSPLSVPCHGSEHTGHPSGAPCPRDFNTCRSGSVPVQPGPGSHVGSERIYWTDKRGKE